MALRSSDGAEELRRRLVGAGLLIPTGVDGLYGRSGTYEEIVAALGRIVHALGAGQGAIQMSFPPVVAKDTLERAGYVEAFTNLIGAVRCFSGSSEEHADLVRSFSAGEDWTEHFGPSDIALASAACHPVYPTCTGLLPSSGRRFEVSSYCFRHEPSLDPARMLAFRMHEHVYVGDPAGALPYRDTWLDVARGALAGLGLEVGTAPANDPFFGRGSHLLAEAQRKEERKIEILVLLPGYETPTAVASGNWAQDHFGALFGIECGDGQVAHSSCMAFGLDRIAIALLACHGLDPAGWPAEVRSKLWP